MMVALSSIIVCIIALLVMVWLLRRDQHTLGLPVAYLLALLLIHVPGAYAAIASGGLYGGTATQEGIALTAVGVVFFVAGVWAALGLDISRILRRRRQAAERRGTPGFQPQVPGPPYWMFCLLAGWALIYCLTPLTHVPSIGAAIDKGGAIWMLGVILGLAYAFQTRDLRRMAFWGAAVFVYPAMMLLLGGFLSYGSTAVIVVGSILLIVARRFWAAAAALALSSFVGISVFVNYFAARDQLRSAVWGGASMDERIGIVKNVLSVFGWFSVNNPAHLEALDKRLNQNYFIGMAAQRLREGQVDLLHGKSLLDGLFALVPRVLWPGKPATGGSGRIVADMTGLYLNENTSWGVGNVMEFYINFGVVGVAVGFIVLGWAIATLDRRTATTLREGDLGGAFLFFLPCVALIQPNGSVMELTSGAAAALLAGFFWRWAWRFWTAQLPARMSASLQRNP